MASLITANRGVTETLSLDFVGLRHGRRFAIYVEIFEFQDLSHSEFIEGADLLCEAERLDEDKRGWWSEIGKARIPSYSERTTHCFHVLWVKSLETGRWRLSLKVNGREVASREVEISGAAQ